MTFYLISVLFYFNLTHWSTSICGLWARVGNLWERNGFNSDFEHKHHNPSCPVPSLVHRSFSCSPSLQIRVCHTNSKYEDWHCFVHRGLCWQWTKCKWRSLLDAACYIFLMNVHETERATSVLTNQCREAREWPWLVKAVGAAEFSDPTNTVVRGRREPDLLSDHW